MRIIGNIEHPHLKITIFKMEGRMSVKFENMLYEQTYKIPENVRLNDLESVKALVDGAFIQNVLVQFQEMHRNRMDALNRHLEQETEQFEEII